jgi:hypothetical protein
MKRLLTISIVILLASAALAQESFVQLPADSTGKKLRMFQQTVGANTVYLQGFYWANTAGNEIGLVGSPAFVQFSDGAASYVGAKTGQLPTALDGSGFLKVHEQGTATISGTVTSNQGIAAAIANAWPFRLTDLTNYMPTMDAAARRGYVQVTDGTNNATVTAGGSVNVNCTGGCTAGGSFADSSVFTFGTTAVGNISAVVDDVSTNTVAENSAGAVRMNTNRILYVDLSKTAVNATAVKTDGSAVTQPVGQATGTNLHAVIDTGSTTAVTQATGTNLHAVLDTTSTTAVTQATGTNLHSVVDSGSITATQATGTNLHVVVDTAPTTAVTNTGLTDLDLTFQTVTNGTAGTKSQLIGGVFNTTPPTLTNGQGSAAQANAKGELIVSQPTAADLNVTVTQATGTNLHAVLDTTSTTAVTQATGTNLHAVVDSGSITVVQGTGTNLHTVVDTAPTTAVTNVGLTDLDATTQTVTNGTAGTKSQLIGTVFNIALPTLTNGQGAAAQGNAKGELIIAQPTAADLNVTATGTVAVTQATGTNLHAVIDSTSTTAVTQATATNLNAAVVGTGTAGTPAGNILTVQGVASMTKLLVTPDSVALPANQSVNLAQVGGTNTVTGGVAGIIAVGGNVANAVAATANPVPVGGIFTTIPSALTTGQTATLQFTAAQNAKHDITTIAGTAPTTVGKLDVKGADGDVFVRQATAANLNATVVQGAAGTAAAAWFAKATDGTNTAAVKAASTAAAATDPALVVAVSPNNTIPMNETQLASTAITSGYGVSTTGTQRVMLAHELTYGASLTIKTATAAGTGPFFSICGSATTTARIQKFSVSGTILTTGVYADVVIKKTSAATSGGTATALVRVPYDSNDAAATVATPNFYTVLATAGTLVGVIDSQMTLFPTTAIATTTPDAGKIVFDWRNRTDTEPLVLRGTAQCMEASFGTTTTNAPTLLVSVVWTEK